MISGFLKSAQQRDWIAENPLTKIPAHRIRRRRGGAQTLTATQAQELMEFVENNHPAAVPFFALCVFVAKFRSIGEAALQAGNSESIIRKHYLDLKDAGEADEFWRIVPKRISHAQIEGEAASFQAPQSPSLRLAVWHLTTASSRNGGGVFRA